MGCKVLVSVTCDWCDEGEPIQVTGEIELCSTGVDIIPDLPTGWRRERVTGYGVGAHYEFFCPKHQLVINKSR